MILLIVSDKEGKSLSNRIVLKDVSGLFDKDGDAVVTVAALPR